jgi:hypothetical protein
MFPLVCRLDSEDPERRSRNEMAFKVEDVVNGGELLLVTPPSSK